MNTPNLEDLAVRVEQASGGFLIPDAPRDRDILVYNPMTGWYRSRYADGEFPLRNWDGLEGTWYPVPTKWREVHSPTSTDGD